MAKPDSAENFHPVPAIRRARSAHPLAGKGASSNTNPHGQSLAQHGAVTKTTVHGPNDPENPSPGKHHVTATHADGHEAHSIHSSSAQAHDHAEQLSSGGDAMQSDGKVDTAEETCPHCGGRVVDGKCQQCGYDMNGEEAKESPAFEAGEQEGAGEY